MKIRKWEKNGSYKREGIIIMGKVASMKEDQRATEKQYQNTKQ